MKFTDKLPTKPGFYWWTNFGEHTPTILEVAKDGGNLYAANEEFGFFIKPKVQEELELKLDKEEENLRDGYRYGDELWCYIPCPKLPNGKQIEPDCY